MSKPALIKQRIEDLEDKLSSLGYIIRTSKGVFRSNYCLLKERKLVIINRALDQESKLAFLRSVLEELEHEHQS